MSRKDSLNKSLKLMVSSSAIVLIGLILSKALSYIYRIAIARYFGPEIYGLVSLAIITVGWFVTIAGLGLADGILRYLVIYKKKEPSKSQFIFRFIWKTSLVSSVVAALLLLILAEPLSIYFFKDPALLPFLQWFSLSIPLLTFAHIYLSILRANEKIGWYSFILNILQNVIKVAVIIVFLLIGLKTSAIITSYVISIAAMFLVSYWAARKYAPSLFFKATINVKERKKIRHDVLTYSLPLLFFNLMYSVFYWIDSISLGFFKEASVVGLYNAAVPIALLLAVAPELFVQLFLPLITKAYARKNKFLVEELSKQVSKWILLINLPLFVTLIVFPEVVLDFLFGPQFIGASDALRILSIGALLSSLFVVWQQLTYAQGNSNLFLKNMIVASIINIVLNAVLIPRPIIGFIDNSLGLEGAAIATLVSIICFNILFIPSIYRYLQKVPFRRKMLNVVIAMFIPLVGLVAYSATLTQPNIFIVIGLMIIVSAIYAGLLFFLRAFDAHDKEMIKAVMNKIKKN